MSDIKIEDFILEYNNFWNKDQCDFAIQYFDHIESCGLTLERELRRHEVSDNSVIMHFEKYANIRNTKDISRSFTSDFWERAYAIYSKQFSILTGYEAHTIYHLKIQKTQPGEGYHTWHGERGNKHNELRILSFILYLNDIEDGGETEFLYYSKRIKAETGKLILFPGGFTHTHRGNQPLKKDKYIITGWVEF